jgi:hypothetical protein
MTQSVFPSYAALSIFNYICFINEHEHHLMMDDNFLHIITKVQ